MPGKTMSRNSPTASAGAQVQTRQPGTESGMTPQPLSKGEWYKGSGKLNGKVALITGGDSGIGRSVAIFFAREGADVAISYLDEHEDAERTRKDVEDEGRHCLLLPGDISRSQTCAEIVSKTVRTFGKLDILVNNAARQEKKWDFTEVSDEQLRKTFETNIFSQFYVTREALKHLPERTGVIINTTSRSPRTAAAGPSPIMLLPRAP